MFGHRRNDILYEVSLTAFAVLVTANLCSLGWAHGAGGDIAVFSTAGQVDIGFAILDDNDEQQIFFDPNECVFSSVLIPIEPNPIVPWEFGSPEPGFDADEGTLPPSAEIVVNLLELSYWNGTGALDFLAVAGINAGVAPQPLESFPSGGFHSHPYFGIDDPAGVPADGVYVGKQTLSVAGLIDSEPFYMVSLLTDAVTSLPTLEEQVAAAETIGELVRTYIEDPHINPPPIFSGEDYTFYADAVIHTKAICMVPEPGTGLLLMLTIVALPVLKIRTKDN